MARLCLGLAAIVAFFVAIWMPPVAWSHHGRGGHLLPPQEIYKPVNDLGDGNWAVGFGFYEIHPDGTKKRFSIRINQDGCHMTPVPEQVEG